MLSTMYFNIKNLQKVKSYEFVIYEAVAKWPKMTVDGYPNT